VLGREWEEARAALISQARSPSAASDAFRELREFYTQGEDCLWFTFADGHLWWAFTQSEVVDARSIPGDHGAVMRKVRAWSSTSILGEPLRIDALSSRLTQVAGYRKSICQISDVGYLLRRINGIDEPATAEARSALEQAVTAASALIERLHWSDFELLVDLIFQRSGWRRVSKLGGTLKDADLVLEQPMTSDLALVQVKSRATQAVLDRYEMIFRQSNYQRLFFICHSPDALLVPQNRDGVHIWVGDEIARRALDVGLMPWLIERAS